MPPCVVAQQSSSDNFFIAFAWICIYPKNAKHYPLNAKWKDIYLSLVYPRRGGDTNFAAKMSNVRISTLGLRPQMAMSYEFHSQSRFTTGSKQRFGELRSLAIAKPRDGERCAS